MRRLQSLPAILLLALSACSTTTVSPQRAETHSYDIHNLAKRYPLEGDLNSLLAGRSSASGFDVQLASGSESVQREIVRDVKPSTGTWLDGPDTIRACDGMLTVNTTPAVHLAVDAWLARKRSEVTGKWIVE